MTVEIYTCHSLVLRQDVWLSVERFEAGLIQVNFVALLVCGDDRLARRVLVEGDCLPSNVSTEAVPWADKRRVGLDMDLRGVFVLHDVVLIGHKYGGVAGIGKLVPVIDMMDLEGGLARLGQLDSLATGHV